LAKRRELEDSADEIEAADIALREADQGEYRDV
jgi:hypothetical protein